MKSLGVETTQEDDSLVLRKRPFEKRLVHFDFSAHPDLFPTMSATCAGMQVEALFSGISNLNIKESDRVASMAFELAKIFVEIKQTTADEVVLKPCRQLPYFEPPNPLFFASHNDHRIVMSLAPLTLQIGAIRFDNPEVVKKSYPRYWSDVAFLLDRHK